MGSWPSRSPISTKDLPKRCVLLAVRPARACPTGARRSGASSGCNRSSRARGRPGRRAARRRRPDPRRTARAAGRPPSRRCRSRSWSCRTTRRGRAAAAASIWSITRAQAPGGEPRRAKLWDSWRRAPACSQMPTISATDCSNSSLRVRWWQACTRPVRATMRLIAVNSAAEAARPGTYSRPVERPSAPSVERLCDQTLHVADGLGGGRFLVVAHHGAADGPVTDEHGDVSAQAAGRQCVQILAERAPGDRGARRGAGQVGADALAVVGRERGRG